MMNPKVSANKPLKIGMLLWAILTIPFLAMSRNKIYSTVSFTKSEINGTNSEFNYSIKTQDDNLLITRKWKKKSKLWITDRDSAEMKGNDYSFVGNPFTLKTHGSSIDRYTEKLWPGISPIFGEINKGEKDILIRLREIYRLEEDEKKKSLIERLYDEAIPIMSEGSWNDADVHTLFKIYE